jgi:type 1 fimbria pilin
MMRRGSFRGSLALASLMASALLSAPAVPARAADDTPVRFEGRVLWIAGATLMVATDDSQTINVDLTHVPQDEYQRLGSYDRVVVTGTILCERNRVGISIEPLESSSSFGSIL